MSVMDYAVRPEKVDTRENRTFFLGEGDSDGPAFPIPEDTERVRLLRRRVRDAMSVPHTEWHGPERIDPAHQDDPLPVRKARAIATKLAAMPVGHWDGQLIGGSMTLENPRMHLEHHFPEYRSETEVEAALEAGVGINCFGHVVPDYPRLLRLGLSGVIDLAEATRPRAKTAKERAFLDSCVTACRGVIEYARRLARFYRERSEEQGREPGENDDRAAIAAVLERVPEHPAESYHEALQSVWLLHMIFHSCRNPNALGRVDQYLWPFLERDLAEERIGLEEASELTGCFLLKFNERASTEEMLRDENRDEAADRPPSKRPGDPKRPKRPRHGASSSQLGSKRDQLDATNHWLQNIVIGGLTPEGADGINPLSFLILENYRRNRMTNPVLTARLHDGSPDSFTSAVAESLKDGGGMPALFNDETLIPAIHALGIPIVDARDYTNDGCWETIIPGRTDFYFQRISLMLPLEWVLNRGASAILEEPNGIDTGPLEALVTFDDFLLAYTSQLDNLIERVVRHRIESVDNRSRFSPVPLQSALTQGPIENMKDLTGGGAKFRTFGMLAESTAHAIDSLTAVKHVVYESRRLTLTELAESLQNDFTDRPWLRKVLIDTPKYGNDDPRADEMGRRVLNLFTETVRRHGDRHRDVSLFPCGVATFSWYIGIGEGLGASPDGRLSRQPVASNFSPVLGRDTQGVPGAILSYCGMPHYNLPEGGPLDLRIPAASVRGPAGTERIRGLIRGFVENRGAMMTLTVADTEELKAAQRDPDRYESLRVRMGGWCAYFTMLSREQQDHHIRRQEGA